MIETTFDFEKRERLPEGPYDQVLTKVIRKYKDCHCFPPSYKQWRLKYPDYYRIYIVRSILKWGIKEGMLDREVIEADLENVMNNVWTLLDMTYLRSNRTSEELSIIIPDRLERMDWTSIRMPSYQPEKDCREQIDKLSGMSDNDHNWALFRVFYAIYELYAEFGPKAFELLQSNRKEMLAIIRWKLLDKMPSTYLENQRTIDQNLNYMVACFEAVLRPQVCTGKE